MPSSFSAVTFVAITILATTSALLFVSSGDASVAAATQDVATLLQSFGTGCSGEHCCSGGATCSSSSGLTTGTPKTKFPLSLSTDCSCDGGRCQCYDTGCDSTILDLTQVANANPNKNLVLQCSGMFSNPQGCTETTIFAQILKPARSAQPGKDAFFPAPYTSNCTNSKSENGCTKTTVLRSFSCDASGATNYTCSMKVPLLSPSKLGGGFLLQVNPVSSCKDMFCIYGGSAAVYVSCKAHLV